MDQDLSWWAEVVFGGWRDRPGPRYQRLAAAVGVSRGTVVACGRRQGSGIYVAGRPSWAARPAAALNLATPPSARCWPPSS